MKKKLPSESDDLAGLVGAEIGDPYSEEGLREPSTGGGTGVGTIGTGNNAIGRGPGSGAVAPAKAKAKKTGRES